MHENHLQQKKISLGFTLQHKLGIEKKSTKWVNKKLFYYYHYHPNVQCKAVLSEKLMGAQCSELVKSSVPSIYDSYEKAKISSRPRTKVRHHRPAGSARAKACMFGMHQSWNSKSSTSILGGGGGTPQQLTITCAQWVGNLTFPWVGWGIWTASFKLNFLTQSSVWQHSLIDALFLI